MTSAPLLSAPGATRAAVERAMAQFVPTPADVAQYEIGVPAACLILGTGQAWLDVAVEAGFPCSVDGWGDLRFDEADLINLGLFSGTGRTGPELALRYAMRFSLAGPAAWFSSSAWEVSLRGRPPLPILDLEAPGVSVLEACRVVGGDRGEVRYRLALSGELVEVPGAGVRHCWREVVEPMVTGAVHFQVVSERLRADPLRAWGMGVADCAVASRVLAGALAARGVPARVRRGVQLGLHGSEHVWCEIPGRAGAVARLDPLFALFGAQGHPVAGGAPNPAFAQAAFGARFAQLVPYAGDDGPSPSGALSWVTVVARTITKSVPASSAVAAASGARQ